MSTPIPPSSSSLPVSRLVIGPRVTPSAAHAFGGIWRLSVRRFFNLNRWLVLLGMLVLLVLFSIPETLTREAATHGFVPWAARFYICFLVPLLAFLSAAGTVRDDLQAGAIDYLFTRPVRRPVFVLFRYVAHVTCVQLDFLIALAVIAGIGVYHDVPELWAAVSLLFFAQFLAVLAFSAFGFLCAMITSRYVIIGLLYGAFIEVGMGSVPTQLSRLSMSRQTLGILSPLLGNPGGEQVFFSGSSVTTAIMLLLGTSLVMLGATALIFQVREPAGGLGRAS